MRFFVVFHPACIGVDPIIGRGPREERVPYSTLKAALQGRHLDAPQSGYVAYQVISESGEVHWQFGSDPIISEFN